MSCARCARLMSWLAKCSRCRARFQARNERKEIPVSSLNKCRNRDGDSPASAAQLAAVTGSPQQRFTKTQGIEFGAGEFGAGVMFAQFAISGADAAGESFAFRPREAFSE